MNIEKYIPIGSVVILKGGSKRVMVIGFCCMDEQKRIFDYAGCLYPEGVLSSDKTLLFDHNQIERIYCLGYSDVEEKEFKAKLNEMMKNNS